METFNLIEKKFGLELNIMNIMAEITREFCLNSSSPNLMIARIKKTFSKQLKVSFNNSPYPILNASLEKNLI